MQLNTDSTTQKHTTTHVYEKIKEEIEDKYIS